MPIVKIPMVKKFGIISTKYHEELRKRLIERREESRKDDFSDHRKPLEVTEEFIKQFNAAKELEDQERMLDSARKILHRCKRKSGLYAKNQENHVNLQLAWTDMMLLTQCQGKVQEEALDILLLSMDKAALNEEHIPLLFFMAESVLYRICCDATEKPYLFSSEAKLSKLGLLTFLRLYTFHLLDKLLLYEDQKARLSIYLKALQACEAPYQHYPNILLSVHIILGAGEAICDGADLETMSSLQNQAVSIDQSSVHPEKAQISQFLWHCLFIWQQVENSSTNLHDVIRHLLLLKEHLHRENWLESIIAIVILGDAAKKELSCLEALMDIGSYILSDFHQMQPLSPAWPWEVIFIYIMTLAHVCLHGSTSDIQKYSFIGFIRNADNDIFLVNDLEQEMVGYREVGPFDHSVWIIPYCTVHSLVQICHALKKETNRDGLRNEILKALYKNKSIERDTRVLDAEKVAEAEVKGLTNPFISTTLSATESLALFQHVGGRLASTLAQWYLPPVEHCIPAQRKAFQTHVIKKATHVKEASKQKKASCPPLRLEGLLACAMMVHAEEDAMSRLSHAVHHAPHCFFPPSDISDVSRIKAHRLLDPGLRLQFFQHATNMVSADDCIVSDTIPILCLLVKTLQAMTEDVIVAQKEADICAFDTSLIMSFFLILLKRLLLDKPPSPLLDFNTRTNMDLRKVLEEQWEKELKSRMEEEEEATKKVQQEKAEREEEHLKEILRKREEKLKKTNKPYELPTHSMLIHVKGHLIQKDIKM
ncbi:transmembrane protein 232 [Gastrophryne carolinensis]